MRAGAIGDADAAARYSGPMPALIRFLQLILIAHGRLNPVRLHLVTAGYVPGGFVHAGGCGGYPPDLDLP